MRTQICSRSKSTSTSTSTSTSGLTIARVRDTDRTRVDVDGRARARHADIAALDKLVTLVLHVTRADIAAVPTALRHIRSPRLRTIGIVHRVEDQTPAATARQLEALAPPLPALFARPAFWSLQALQWFVRCQVWTGDKEEEEGRWREALMPFLRVMADRNVLVLAVDGELNCLSRAVCLLVLLWVHRDGVGCSVLSTHALLCLSFRGSVGYVSRASQWRG